jgi:hypothetical protein
VIEIQHTIYALYSSSYHIFLLFSKFVVHRLVWSFGTRFSLYNTLIGINCVHLNVKTLNKILCHVKMLNLEFQRYECNLDVLRSNFLFYVNHISALKIDLLNPSLN